MSKWHKARVQRAASGLTRTPVNCASRLRRSGWLDFFDRNGLNDRAKTCVVNSLYHIPLKLDQVFKLQAI